VVGEGWRLDLGWLKQWPNRLVRHAMVVEAIVVLICLV
jgi:hypothetical protein